LPRISFVRACRVIQIANSEGERTVKEKILIVDDNIVNRKLLFGILQKEGYELLEAPDGEEAIKAAVRFLPDLILLDIMMPKKDGYEVCKELKSDNRFKAIPIVFLSAKAEVEDKIRGLELGAADYVTKPFDRGEVLARCRAQLKIRDLTKRLTLANQDLMEKQRLIDEDLKAAAGIQRSLLPQDYPDVDIMNLAWKFMPCQSIGGDIFNLIRLDEHHWGIYMLDVSGHGVPAALVAVSVSQMMRSKRGLLLKRSIDPPPYYEIVPPVEVLRRLDEEYPIERFDKFFTITYIILDASAKRIQYSNAAHPPPVLVSAEGTIEYLDKGGTIIGMGGVLPFEGGEKQLRSGDKLVIYTDGILEYQDKEGNFYGEGRFFGVLKRLKAKPISTIMDGLMASAMDFGGNNEPQDDVSLFGIEIK
jgi:sigma-B regulation protein RsbU (phosphoserine phosphatase)